MKTTRFISVGMFILIICTSITNLPGQTKKAPQGAINGLFSINDAGDQVYFSQGNLQYIGSAPSPYWKFADHQWEVLGKAQDGDSSDKDRDLFGWGTSGYPHGAECYQPWSTLCFPDRYMAYGSYKCNLYNNGGKADWGFNPISNGGNVGKTWRTPTAVEFLYICGYRKTQSGILFAKAQVNGINGLIILPDDWSPNTYTLHSTNEFHASFSSNVITLDKWNILEKKGAVFLPAAGQRLINSAGRVGNDCWYWTSSTFGSLYKDQVHVVRCEDKEFCVNFCFGDRSNGNAVRLIQDAN